MILVKPQKKGVKRKYKQRNKLIMYRQPNVNKLIYNSKNIKKVRKYISWDVNQDVLYSSPYLDLFNSVQRGTGDGNRIGDEIFIKSMQYKFIAYPKYRPSNTVNQARRIPTFAITIVYDKTPRGALPSISGSADSIFNGANPHDLPLFANTNRYTILSNKMFTPNNTSQYFVQTVGTTSVAQLDWKCDGDFYRKLGLKTEYNGATSYNDIRDINSGAIYMVFRTDATSDGTNWDDTVRIDLDLRFRFDDV